MMALRIFCYNAVTSFTHSLMEENHKHGNVEDEVYKKHFRVSIFGSARIKPGDEQYKQVFELAKAIGAKGHDIVTGGGPGMMEAANAGHRAGDVTDVADSIGLTIKLQFEEKGNRHLDLQKHFEKFSNRLDHFMALSNVVVVTPGGIGTCLELFYTWQLTQVKHICSMPIILLGEMWEDLIKWVKEGPLAAELISQKDMANIYVVKDNQEAIKIINNCHEVYKKEQENYCFNYLKYPLDK